jgi:CheY-like chemotaxis protein
MALANRVIDLRMTVKKDGCHTPKLASCWAIALEATGREFDVCSITDGKSAPALLRSGRELPALILLDIRMPGMGGIEVRREMRADDRLRDIRVVVVTSSCLESDRVEAIAAGASGYIQKSLALDQFSKDLESVLRCWLPN